MIEAVARATGRAVDNSVSLGASRQRPVCHETRGSLGAHPAPCLCARRHVLLRDLHLAHHGHCGRPSGHRRAWARRVGARQPDLRCYRCYPRSASTFCGGHGKPNNCTLFPETGSARPFRVCPTGQAQDGIALLQTWALRVGIRLLAAWCLCAGRGGWQQPRVLLKHPYTHSAWPPAWGGHAGGAGQWAALPAWRRAQQQPHCPRWPAAVPRQAAAATAVAAAAAAAAHERPSPRLRPSSQTLIRCGAS